VAELWVQGLCLGEEFAEHWVGGDEGDVSLVLPLQAHESTVKGQDP